LLFNDVVVPDVGFCSCEGLTCQNIHSERFIVFEMRVLNLNQGVLWVETRVLSQCTWHHQQCVCETPDSQLDFSRNFLGSGVLLEGLTGGDLESTGTWNDRLVLQSVLDGAETVTDGVLGLGDRVVIWSLDENGAGEWVLHALNEGILVIAEGLLVDELGKTQISLLAVFDGVDLLATAGERDSLTVSALGATDTDDVVAGEDLKRGWVNTLLVDDNKVLVGAVAKALLELDNLHDTIIRELPLRLDELLSLVCVAPEEARVDLGLFVLETHVEAHDVAVLQARGHVALTATVVQDETPHKSRLS